MRNIKITYQYDGSSFMGFAKQPGGLRTIQGEIEKVLEMILREPTKLISSGRTDKGVHASLQVSNFLVKVPIPTDRLEIALKNALPKDIMIKSVEEVEKDFNSRFSAKSRAYEFVLSTEVTPFNWRYVTKVEEKIDEKKLENIMQDLVGRHNFESFRLTDCDADNPVREIFEIKCRREGENITIYVKANAFLKSQIRIMVGTSLQIYRGIKPVDYIKNQLANPNPKAEKFVIQGNGLYLCEINY